MKLSAAQDANADKLARAWIDRSIVSELDPAGWPPSDRASALAIQRSMVEALPTEVAGWKLGATSPAICKMDGHDGPVPGCLLDATRLESPAVCPAAEFPGGRVECEFAFVALEDVPATIGIDELAGKVQLLPSFEIIGSRLPESEQSTLSGIADNGNAWGCVLGKPHPLADIDLDALLTMKIGLEVNGVDRAQNMLGDDRARPLQTLLLALELLATLNETLHKGMNVLTGAATMPVELAPGDRFVGDFGLLGQVEIHFT